MAPPANLRDAMQQPKDYMMRSMERARAIQVSGTRKPQSQDARAPYNLMQRRLQMNPYIGSKARQRYGRVPGAYDKLVGPGAK